MTLSKQDFAIGAIYKMAEANKLPRANAEALLVERAKLKADEARQLASIWQRYGLKNVWPKH